MCIDVQDMKFLWSNLWLGGLSTDDNDDDADKAIHDYIGTSAFIPNEPTSWHGSYLFGLSHENSGHVTEMPNANWLVACWAGGNSGLLQLPWWT